MVLIFPAIFSSVHWLNALHSICFPCILSSLSLSFSLCIFLFQPMHRKWKNKLKHSQPGEEGEGSNSRIHHHLDLDKAEATFIITISWDMVSTLQIFWFVCSYTSFAFNWKKTMRISLEIYLHLVNNTSPKVKQNYPLLIRYYCPNLYIYKKKS